MAFLWILIAALLGFGVAAIFAGKMRLERNLYLIIYIPVVTALILFFIFSNRLNISELISHNLLWGFLGALIAGGFVIRNVFSQPSSARNKGLALLSDILWPGFAYGLADALLLTVLPVLAVKLAFAESIPITGWAGRLGFGAVAMISSFFVTTFYHLGYTEFRGKTVIWPNIGNGILTLAYLLTMNPIAAILPHIAMHIAAMIHGRDTTGQVPPHYEPVSPLLKNNGQDL
jgi:hypothetical protein